MKLITVLLLATCLSASAIGNAQRVSLSEKNATLAKIFKQIKKQTGYDFFYNMRAMEQASRVSIHVKDASLDEALAICFQNQPLTYTISEKMVVVKVKETAVFQPADNSLIIPPPVDVRGRIVNENGEPVLASIVVKGTKIGTTTNNNGEFQLTGVDENATLMITAANIETREIQLNGRSDLGEVGVKMKVESLNEVVINKGYYTEKQRYSVGNVATVTSKDIEKQPVQNPLLALQGRVPGLEITQTTGMNGGGVKIRIQGINSLGSLNRTVGTDPLIVVDGVPFPSQFLRSSIESFVQQGSPLNHINMSDIESISVLKDADATAIYGSRAANGAILITTKKGKAGKSKLSIDLQQGWGKVTKHVDMMNTRQYLDMRYEALKNDGLTPNSNSDYDLTLWDTTRYTNWQKELIGGTAQYTNINAGVSGGTALVQYLVGASFNRQTTVFPGEYADKTGGFHFSLNGGSTNQKLHIQLSGSYSYSGNRLPFSDLTQYAVFLEPHAPEIYNTDGSINWALNAGGRSTWTNPMSRTVNTEYSNATKNLISNMNISYSLLPGLVLSSNFGYNNLRSDLFSGLKSGYYAPERRTATGRSASFGNRNISSWIIEPQLQFEKNIGKGKLNALIGSTLQKSSSDYLQVEASGHPTDELLHSLAAASSIRSGASGNTADYTTMFNGLFGRVSHSWDKKYLVNLTGRRDGSSKFGDENKFHNFWSVGAGWIFSEEKWFRSALPFLSLGKLRASYGTTGNDQIADYSYLSLYNILSTNILYQGTTSFNVAGLSNPFLQWEETRKLQGGIDLSAFNERITLGVTFARNRSSNQLIPYSLPDLTGFTSFTKNFPATIQNTGWEFSLNTINVNSRNFNWNTNINLTIPRNKVTSFPGIELTSYASGLIGVIVGEPIGIQKLYQYGGVDPVTGSYMILDVNGEPIDPNVSTSPFEQTAKISLLPKYYGGISNTISYKGFQLDFLFQFVYQMGSNDFYYSSPLTIPGTFAKGQSNQPVSVLHRWQKPGDNATIGRYNSDYSLAIWPPATDVGFSYAAGSYIRLKNLSLSWQLPKEWSRKTNLRNAQIFFHGQNLATITQYTGLDPETRSLTSLPPLQMWTVGAKIEL